jgi:hypothetical protein
VLLSGQGGRVNSNPGRKSDDTHNKEKIEAAAKIPITTAKNSGDGSEISYFDRNGISVTLEEKNL